MSVKDLSLSQDLTTAEINQAGNTPRWPARLALTLAKTDRGSRLLERNHEGPLYVQRPFYPEGPDHAHIYLLHPPGGIVSGDSLDVTLDINSNAGGLFTTPGAGRIYRARHDTFPQSQTVELTLDRNTIAEWLPLETIVFHGCNGVLKTRVNLPDCGSALFIGWEILCLGLPASQAEYTQGQLTQSFEIWAGNTPLLLERMRLDAEDQALLQNNAGFQSRRVSAFMVAGPFNDGSSLREMVDQLTSLTASEKLCAITRKGAFLVVRLLADTAQSARVQLVEVWRLLRPQLIGKSICEPGIWRC